MALAVMLSFSPGQAMYDHPSHAHVDNVRQLVDVLNHAYPNSLQHETENTNPKIMDLRLESAAIELSSRILHEITDGSCQKEEPIDTDGTSTSTCFLDDESLKLMDLTTMLSYAANRLETLDSSRSAVGGIDGQLSLVKARARSMQHLYRMVLAVSRIHFDRSQRALYVDAARLQLRLARVHVETELHLCACDPSGYSTRLAELSRLDDLLKDLQTNPSGMEQR